MKEQTRRWLMRADDDLGLARLAVREGSFPAGVLFLCQQAVEKSLKAVLVEATDTSPPRIHDLRRLAAGCTLPFSREHFRLMERLTDVYRPSRYPDTAATDADYALVDVADYFR